MKIGIFTEGGGKIGFGHITRCLSIYDEYQKKKYCPKLYIQGDDSVKTILSDYSYRECKWISDLKVIRKLPFFDIVVIDSYLAPISIYNTLVNRASLLICIDDYNRLKYPHDSLVLHTSALDAKCVLNRVTGYKYALIRGAFLANKQKKSINNQIKNILITMGGNDIRGLTPIIVEAVSRQYPHLYLHVLVGNGFKKGNPAHTHHIQYYSNPPLNKLIDLMHYCDLAISSSGQTLNELMCVGTPVIAVQTADNQKNNILSFKDFILFGGNWNNSFLVHNIIHSINRLQDCAIRKNVSKKTKKLIDGLGPQRLVSKSIQYFIKKYVNFRIVQKKDVKLVFNLSNQKQLRANSINQEPLVYSFHKKWFTHILKNTNCIYYVAEYHSSIIGQIRLERKETNAIVSIGIDQDYNGIGLGSRLLKIAVFACKKRFKSVHTVHAVIRQENKRSISFFQKNGFIKEKLVKKDGVQCMIYRYLL